MNQPPNDFNNNESLYPARDREDTTTLEGGSDRAAVSPSDDNARVHTKSFKRIYIILLVLGISVGAILSVGIVAVLNRLGMTDNRPQIEQIRE